MRFFRPRSPIIGPIPKEAFELGAEMYPLFLYVLRMCHLKGHDFFVLSFLRRSQQKLNARPARLLTEVRDALIEAVGKPSGFATTVIKNLDGRGLVSRPRISPTERQEKFGEGRNQVVCLTIEGVKLLDDFNDHVNTIVGQILTTVEFRETTIGLVRGRFLAKAQQLIVAARRLAEQRWAGLRGEKSYEPGVGSDP